MSDDAEKLGPLAELVDEVATLIRMVRAYVRGEYRDIPYTTLAAALGAVIYVVVPTDLIPDFIPVAGFADDAAVVAFVLASIAHDLDAFRQWEDQWEERGGAGVRAPRKGPGPKKPRAGVKAKKPSGAGKTKSSRAAKSTKRTSSRASAAKS
jgi:uncharacterized membrane protein YkvA (DUF1232 family)